jgi:hypothetical protein
VVDISVCGNVIVTDMAIIVVAPDPGKTRAMRAGAAVAGHIAAGAIGGALGRGVGPSVGGSLLNLGDGQAVPPLAHMTRTTTCWPSEVPDELSTLADWPRIAPGRPLTFYPRSVVDSVRLSWTGQLKITLVGQGLDVEAGVNFWQVPKAKAHLMRAGYRIA